jgi:hypothetical protein
MTTRETDKTIVRDKPTTTTLSAQISPDRRERQAGTLVRAAGAGASPTVITGQMVTRLMPCSCANLHASFSKSTLDTGYACKASGPAGAISNPFQNMND